jgi:hypothetical protein
MNYRVAADREDGKYGLMPASDAPGHTNLQQAVHIRRDGRSVSMAADCAWQSRIQAGIHQMGREELKRKFHQPNPAAPHALSPVRT